MNQSVFEQRWFMILISLIWGFGLALLFKRTCANTECVIVKVPPQFYKSGMIIHDKNNHCYKLERYDSACAY